MNTRATLSNGRTVKENGEMVVVREMQFNFEVVLEIRWVHSSVVG
jgi:hypothetical protein